MRTTEYFELNIVEGSDLVNPLTQQNPNFEKIDEQMFKNQNNGVCLATELKTASVHAINRTVPDCAMFRFTATSDFVSGDTFTVDGVQVTAKLTNGQPLGTGAFVINSEVIGVLVGTLVTFYIESGVVPTASDSERLGGELPSYYAKKTEVDQAQQLAEASATIGQENQQAINELNGKLSVPIWENPDPTVDFTPQTLNIDLLSYSYYEVIYCFAKNNTTRVFSTGKIPTNCITTLTYFATVCRHRNISTNTGNTIYVDDCYITRTYGQESSEKVNAYMIPLKILGYK